MGSLNNGVVKMSTKTKEKRKRERDAKGVGMVSCIVLLKVCVLLPACFHRHLCSIHFVSSFFFSFRFSRVSLTTTLGSTRIEDSPR